MHVETTGSGTPLLIIHATGASTEWWGDVRSDLESDHQVTAYDRRGYGRTAGKPCRDVRKHAADAAELIDAPAIVVGHSSGGTTALQLTLDHPEKVAGLVVIEPAVHAVRSSTPDFLRAAAKAKALQARGKTVAAAECFERWASGYSHGGNAYDGLPEELRAIMRASARSVLADLDLAPYSAGGEHLRLDRLQGLRIPATLVLGSASRVWFHRMAHRLGLAWPALGLDVVEGASHYVPTDDPAAVVAAVRRVSRRVEGLVAA